MKTRSGQDGSRFEVVATEAAKSLGLEIVEIRVRNQGMQSVVRIDIDRSGPGGVTLDDCEAMSRAFDDGLERLGIERNRHELQVSSPGLDRPIRTPDDIRRNTGRRVVVESTDPVEGVRVLHGELLGERDGALVVVLDSGREAAVPLSLVRLAHQELEPPRRPPKSRR